MQITISDHDSHHLGKRSGFKFWVKYEAGKHEYTTWINFADFIEWLVAGGEFDGYDNSTDNGAAWRYIERNSGRCATYTFNEVISEYLMTGDLIEELKKYLAVRMVIEDLVLEYQAA